MNSNEELADGFGRIYHPDALQRKLPGAATGWKWQFVFPSAAFSIDPRSGAKRRHHAHEGSVSREISRAVKESRIAKRATHGPGREPARTRKERADVVGCARRTFAPRQRAIQL